MNISSDSQKPTIQPIKSPLKKTIDQKGLLRHQVYNPKNLKAVKGSPPSQENEDQYRRFRKNYVKLLQKQDILSSAGYTLDQNAAFRNTYFASGMKSKSASLSSFEMVSWSKVNHPGAKDFFKSFDSLKNLRKLQVTFHYCEYFSLTNELHLLFHRLLCMKKLNDFTFSAFNCREFSITHLDALCSFLARSPQLQILSLNFKSTVEDGNQFLNALIPALSRLTSLTRIHLLFKEIMSISAENITKLFMTLSTIKTLTDLTILPNSYITLDKNSSIEPLAEGLQYLNASSIKRLHFQTNPNLPDKGFIKVAQTLQNFTSLQKLHLDLSESRLITDEGFTQLSSILSGLLSLNSLSLSFSSFPQDIASALISLQNLVHLKLSFDIENIGSVSFDQFQQLYSSLTMLKSSLKSLEINSNIQSDSMIESLAEALKELTLIQNFSLNLEYTSNVTSKGFKAIFQAIQGLSNLSSLTLNFARNQGFDQAAVIALSQALESLLFLDSIELNLAEESRRNSQGNDLQSLFAVIYKMKKSCKLNLRLSHCPDQEVENLKKRFNLRTDGFFNVLQIMTL